MLRGVLETWSRWFNKPPLMEHTPATQRYVYMSGRAMGRSYMSASTILTSQHMMNAYARLIDPPDEDSWVTASTVNSTQLNGMTGCGIFLDEVEEPPCEDLGEFLLRKYNKEKKCSIA